MSDDTLDNVTKEKVLLHKVPPTGSGMNKVRPIKAVVGFLKSAVVFGTGAFVHQAIKEVYVSKNTNESMSDSERQAVESQGFYFSTVLSSLITGVLSTVADIVDRALNKGFGLDTEPENKEISEAKEEMVRVVVSDLPTVMWFGLSHALRATLEKQGEQMGSPTMASVKSLVTSAGTGAFIGTFGMNQEGLFRAAVTKVTGNEYRTSLVLKNGSALTEFSKEEFFKSLESEFQGRKLKFNINEMVSRALGFAGGGVAAHGILQQQSYDTFMKQFGYEFIANFVNFLIYCTSS